MAKAKFRDYGKDPIIQVLSAADTFIHQGTGTAMADLEGFQCRFDFNQEPQ